MKIINQGTLLSERRYTFRCHSCRAVIQAKHGECTVIKGWWRTQGLGPLVEIACPVCNSVCRLSERSWT